MANKGVAIKFSIHFIIFFIVVYLLNNTLGMNTNIIFLAISSSVFALFMYFFNTWMRKRDDK